MEKTQAEELLSCVSLFREVDMLSAGLLRIETAFKYPDGTSIDVFVRPSNLFSEITLTDCGQTTAWLLDLQIKPWLSKKRRTLLEDALRTYDVRQSGGELTVDISGPEQLPQGIIRLSQACLRMADLVFTRRSSFQNSFSEEVEEVLSDSELAYENNKELPGRNGRIVPIDFYVRGARTKSMVLMLASGNQNSAHVMSNEIFKKWYDLDTLEHTEQRITIYDDRSDVYKTDDLDRLEELSTVIPFADKPAWRSLMAA